MLHPTDRITHTTSFVTPVVEHWLEREIAQWVHPMKDRSDDPSRNERTLLPRSYISLLAKHNSLLRRLINFNHKSDHHFALSMYTKTCSIKRITRPRPARYSRTPPAVCGTGSGRSRSTASSRTPTPARGGAGASRTGRCPRRPRRCS